MALMDLDFFLNKLASIEEIGKLLCSEPEDSAEEMWLWESHPDTDVPL